MEKFKTILIIILGCLALVLTVGFWDPFRLRKEKKLNNKDYDKERQNEKTKTELKTRETLVDLATTKPGNDRDNKLKSILDEDYPGSK
jgi:regulatory protein YycH of two-component signal transduction system YycFG